MEHLNFYKTYRDEGVRFGWKNAKKYFLSFLQLGILVAIVNVVPPMVINLIMGQPYDTPNFGDAISIVLSLIVGFGMIKIYLKFARENIPSLTDLWNHDWIRVLWWLLASIIAGVLVMIGFVLLIIPGFIVSARLSFFQYFVVEKKMNAIEAITASREITKGHVWQIIGIWIISFAIVLLGALALGIGLLWAIPTVQLAWARLYVKLTENLPDHTHASA